MKPYKILFFFLLFFIVSCARKEFDLNVKKMVLDNGLTVLLVKKADTAPVFSGYIRFKVGQMEEKEGYWGLAHFFEHMAFKGTPRIGSKNYEEEKKWLEELHKVGSRLLELQAKLREPSDESNEKTLNEEIAALKLKKEELEKKNQEFIEPNEFIRIYQRNGGADLNATTSNDFTSYFVSLPSQKLELWAYLESQRIKEPVLREFYKERDVVAEERRMRYDSNPDGRLFEAFMNNSFKTSPYRVLAIGSAQDIQNYKYEEALEFRKKYYVPSRMVISVVGNFDLKEAEAVIKKYFGDLPPSVDPSASEVSYSEDLVSIPPQKRGVTLIEPQYDPRFYLGYYRPAHPHPDDEVFDVIEEVLCEGRTSRLFKHLVVDKKMVSQISCTSSMPGSRLDGLFTFYAMPLPGFTNDQVIGEIEKIIRSLEEEGVSEEELSKVRHRIDADIIYSMESNMGLASLLTYYESLSGDWEYIYQLRERINKISSQDVKRVMSVYFKPDQKMITKMER